MPDPKTTELHRDLKELIGCTVSFATYKQDDGGYDYVWIEFQDGSELSVIEHSQTGEFKVLVVK